MNVLMVVQRRWPLILLIALNLGADGTLAVRYDLTAWIPGRPSFRVARFDESGSPIGSADGAPSGEVVTRRLGRLEMEVLEFTAR